MESLLSPFPPLLKPLRTHISPPPLNLHRTHLRHATRATLIPRNQTVNPKRSHVLPTKNSRFPQNLAKTQFCLSVIELLASLPSSAAETLVPNEPVSDRINLESIVVSIDDFFNRYPFFVAGCTFVWLVVVPVAEEYFRKYKFISVINAFNKLKSDPNAQLLDVRDRRSLASLGSPSLKIFNKGVVQVEYSEKDEDGFVRNVLEKFSDPENTSVLVLDNSGDNSYKVAELLSKNGFKVAYAIKGGVKGIKGWLVMQETLLPPSVHIVSSKKAKLSQKLETNGGFVQQSEKKDPASSSASVPVVGESQRTNLGHDPASSSASVPVVGESQRTNLGLKDISTNSSEHIQISSRSSSPYPNYPDLKPPSSPTPSKPQN